MITLSAPAPETLTQNQPTLAVHYICTPETQNQPHLAIRYIVELAPIGAEFEFDSYQAFTLAKAEKTVDLSIIRPTQAAEQEAIASVLNSYGLLCGFEILRFWIPSDCDRF